MIRLTMFRVGLLDTGEEFVLIARPPAVGEDFDFLEAGEAGGLDEGTHALEVDAAFAHETTVVEEVFGGNPPVADVVGEKASGGSGARDCTQR